MSHAEERFIKLEKDIENVKEKVDEQGKKISHIHDRFDKVYDYIVQGGLDEKYANKDIENHVYDIKKKFWWIITFVFTVLLSIIGWLVKNFIIDSPN